MGKLNLTMRFVEAENAFEKELLSKDGNQKYEIVDENGNILHTNQTDKPQHISYTPAEYKGIVTMLCADAGISKTEIETVSCDRQVGIERHHDVYYVAQNSILRTVEPENKDDKFSVIVSESPSFDKIDYTYSDKYHQSEIYQTINGKQYPLLFASGHQTERGEVINTFVEITLRDENNGDVEIGKITLRDNGSLQINEKTYYISKNDAKLLLSGELNGIDDVERLVEDIDQTDKTELENLLPEERLLNAIFGAELYNDDVE